MLNFLNDAIAAGLPLLTILGKSTSSNCLVRQAGKVSILILHRLIHLSILPRKAEGAFTTVRTPDEGERDITDQHTGGGGVGGGKKRRKHKCTADVRRNQGYVSNVSGNYPKLIGLEVNIFQRKFLASPYPLDNITPPHRMETPVFFSEALRGSAAGQQRAIGVHRQPRAAPHEGRNSRMPVCMEWHTMALNSAIIVYLSSGGHPMYSSGKG